MALLSRPWLIGATIAAALSASGCSNDNDGVTRVAAIGARPGLVETVGAPLTTGEALVRANMAQGLVRFDERGQVVPGLAERWNVSDDGLSYAGTATTYELDDGELVATGEEPVTVGEGGIPSAAHFAC